VARLAAEPLGARSAAAVPLLHKLFNKESVIAEHASPLFRGAPYIVFGCMALASAIIPTLSTDLPLSPAADAIALVGLFALARVFISLAAMDVGTSFGTLGARREMLIGFLAEPALLMVLFSASLISKSTSLTTIVETLGASRPRDLSEPGLRRRRLHHGFAGRKRSRAGGQPGDPPRTDDDPRGADPRVFGPPSRAARVGREPEAVRLLVHRAGTVFPLGGGRGPAPLALLLALPALVLKLAIGGALLALLETLSAKMRIFRVPEFLATAFLLAVIGMLVHHSAGRMR
jgi:formate hydrogenlyase subunit 4